MKTIDGRKAEVTHSMRYYNNWVTLATEYGHPEAAVHHSKADPRKVPNAGDEVTLLTSTFVHDGAMIWVVATESGDKFLYSEKGLRILDEKVTVMKDELGLQREYREVKRKARVGEKVRVFGHMLPSLDGIHVVRETRSTGHIHFDGGGRLPGGYVVLEPTDIVHVNGERFRIIERKANVGERVVAVNEGGKAADGKSRYYNAGDVSVVIKTGREDVFVDLTCNEKFYLDGGWYIPHENYRVLEPLAPAQQTQSSELEHKSNEWQAQIDGLTETVANLARRLTKAETQLRVAREDIVLIEDGVSEELRKLTDRVAELERGQAPTTKACEPVVSKTSARDGIIDKAKADVAEILAENYTDQCIWFVANDGYVRSHKIEFVINRKKRTVVALIHRVDEPVIDAKGIAKCAPNDCFNVYIGMAIALRHALGLDIPQEYVNAPQPDVAKVDDVVIATDNGFLPGVKGVVTSIVNDGYGGLWYKPKNRGAIYEYQFDIIILDDSRDGRYGEVYSV